MVRTVISLDEKDKRWLDRKAAKDHVSMAEVVRLAVRRMRSEEAGQAAFAELLDATAGLGTGEDGLTAQKRLRDEWNRRPA